jgi:hypothetical protein
MRKFLFVITIAALITACVSAQNMVEIPNKGNVRTGMSIEKLTEVMGEPEAVMQTYQIHHASSPQIPAQQLSEYHYEDEEAEYHIYLDTNDTVSFIITDEKE